MSGSLYYGDNLDILQHYVPAESVDLIYLDPPFNSNQSYNVLFAKKNGTKAAAQIRAFDDTWQWNREAEMSYQNIVEAGGRVADVMLAFRTFLGGNDMLAYLAMMAPRLLELRRVLKPTGSIFLHCDPTASHYLKLLMDAVFGPENFCNEIVWQRTTAKGHSYTRFSSAQDVILFYGAGGKRSWNPQFLPHRDEYKKSHYSRVEPETGRHYQLDNCLNPNRNRPNLTYEWNGLVRVWRWTKDRMQKMADEGRLVYTASGMPRYKRYLDEMKGTPLTSVWTDIPPINSQAQERLGYPTQKPEALLERIIAASSNEGDVVLDPFCGCGTAIVAAEKMRRKWIGVDITHLAITLVRHRLDDAFGGAADYKVIGEPVSLPDAGALAASDPYQFQWWALGLVGARPVDKKKGADKGIDGRSYFHDEPGGKTKTVIFSVKAGKTGPAHVRDLRGVLDRENAQIGALIMMHEPTPQMIAEAASAGFYENPLSHRKYERIQLRTIAELLAGRGIDRPAHEVTFKKAPEKARGEQKNLDL